ncbi:LOW QUALITY PROTEIN: uncharacterized protein LOC128262712 [Drosophila gunungcola]|uniref:LOW QUALITY PROTEIN: uncharacterized protein LOC128262712 n=1 Tax=Drosophila gunungcola TaxID=103775 RepID=UPI0022E953FE|nr:LOW QUALITY PROTEIN: uncharacterized protein LOC128262712 [Drosophila gunungcola]
MFTFCHVCQPSLKVVGWGFLLMTGNMFCCICSINIPLQPKMSYRTNYMVYIAQTGLSRTHTSK